MKTTYKVVQIVIILAVIWLIEKNIHVITGFFQAESGGPLFSLFHSKSDEVKALAAGLRRYIPFIVLLAGGGVLYRFFSQVFKSRDVKKREVKDSGKQQDDL